MYAGKFKMMCSRCKRKKGRIYYNPQYRFVCHSCYNDLLEAKLLFSKKQLEESQDKK